MKPDLDRLRCLLNGCPLGKPIIFLDETTSTNDEVKQRAVNGAPEGLVVWAAVQTSGRGRQGRPWISAAGLGLTFSVLLRPRSAAGGGLFLNLAAALAVARALSAYCPRTTVKWPNDVLINGRKTAGVLVEPSLQRSTIEFAVVGIGLNILHGEQDLQPVGRSDITSLALQGVQAAHEEVLAAVLRELEVCYSMAQLPDKNQLLTAWTESLEDPAVIQTGKTTDV